MVKTIGLLASATVLFLLAACCLIFPAKVQAIALRAMNWGSASRGRAVNASMQLAGKFVESGQYRICLRIIGILALLFSAFLVWMLINHLQGES